MNTVPTIPPGDDFDKQVLYRAWMQSLPSAPVPSDFDQSVLRRAAKGSMTHWWGLAIVAAFLAVIFTITMIPGRSAPVVVRYVPTSPLPRVDLYQLPPAPVVEDTRFAEPQDIAPRRARYGVAGY